MAHILKLRYIKCLRIITYVVDNEDKRPFQTKALAFPPASVYLVRKVSSERATAQSIKIKYTKRGVLTTNERPVLHPNIEQ